MASQTNCHSFSSAETLERKPFALLNREGSYTIGSSGFLNDGIPIGIPVEDEG